MRAVNAETPGIDVGAVQLSDVDGWISDALDALGVDSDEVAGTLARHPAVADSPLDEDPVCLYLQWHLDPAEVVVRIAECDIAQVAYAVRNLDQCTWTHATATLPAPVLIYNCRADAGEFPHLQAARA